MGLIPPFAGARPPRSDVVQGTPMDLIEANLLADEMCISDFLTQFDWYFMIRPMTYRELGTLVNGETDSYVPASRTSTCGRDQENRTFRSKSVE